MFFLNYLEAVPRKIDIFNPVSQANMLNKVPPGKRSENKVYIIS